MNRTVREKHKPYLPPVERIELSENKTRKKIFFLVLLFVVGIILIVHGMVSYLGKESGYQIIEANSASELNCSEDFTFQYNIGASQMAASAEYKQIAKVYTDASVKAYQLFTNDQEFGMNMYYINKHINTEIEVDPILYQAFENLQKYENRMLYLGPIYETYDNIFYCADESQTIDFDPQKNPDMAAYYSKIVVFANDSKQIDIQLLGQNRICLYVSEAYQKFAKDEQVQDYIDFYWMKNAFIIDYLADEMQKNGYTLGVLTSIDGFTRNLDPTDTIYDYTIYDRNQKTIYRAGQLNYTGKRSIVFLHDYPLSEKEKKHYYTYKDGHVVTSMLSCEDGVSKNATHNLLAYAEEKSCTELLLKIIPIYVTDTFKEDAFWNLKNDGIFGIYGDELTLYYDDAQAAFSDLFDKAGEKYQVKYLE